MKRHFCIWSTALLLSPTATAQTGAVYDSDTTAIAARRYAAATPWDITDTDKDVFATFEGLVRTMGLEEGKTADLSDETEIAMPEPRLAYVNLTGITDIPTSKQRQLQAWMEVYDGEGRYFRKRLLVKAQGGYSIRFPKRNFSVAGIAGFNVSTAHSAATRGSATPM